jgi:hypothetical protein
MSENLKKTSTTNELARERNRAAAVRHIGMVAGNMNTIRLTRRVD